MKEFNRIISILFFVLSIISPLNVICDERSDKVKELEIRRNFVKKFSSKSALRLIDSLSLDYEKKYMNDIL